MIGDSVVSLPGQETAGGNIEAPDVLRGAGATVQGMHSGLVEFVDPDHAVVRARGEPETEVVGSELHGYDRFAGVETGEKMVVKWDQNNDNSTGSHFF